MKLIAKVPNDTNSDGINFLVIEHDTNDTNGFFLFFHNSLDKPCEADLWFADIESAQRQAAFNYGITSTDWYKEKV